MIINWFFTTLGFWNLTGHKGEVDQQLTHPDPNEKILYMLTYKEDDYDFHFLKAPVQLQPVKWYSQ